MGFCTVYRILKIRKTYGAAPYDKFRGHDGPIKLKRGPATNPLFQSFFDAGVEAGYHKTPDVNGFRQEGFGPFDSQVTSWSPNVSFKSIFTSSYEA